MMINYNMFKQTHMENYIYIYYILDDDLVG